MTREERRQLELVVAAPHSGLRTSADQTRRMLSAVRSPGVHILGHPRGRKYGARPGVTADWDRIFEAAAERNRRDRDRWRPEPSGHRSRARSPCARRRLHLRARQRRARAARVGLRGDRRRARPARRHPARARHQQLAGRFPAGVGPWAQRIAAREATEGIRENGVHKRRNGVNGDETEKTLDSPDCRIVRGRGRTARSAVGMTGVPVGTSRSQNRSGLCPPARPSSRTRYARCDPCPLTIRQSGESTFFSVSSPFSPFLRL